LKIDRVLEFARKNGNGRIFADWTDDEVRQHLAFHNRNGTLMVVEEWGNIAGFVTYRRIKDFDGDIVPHFWSQSDNQGKDVYIHELCSRREDATYTLFAAFEEANGDAPELSYWAHRQYNLKRYKYRDLKRLKLWESQNHLHHPI